jgi:hypothetical protein
MDENNRRGISKSHTLWGLSFRRIFFVLIRILFILTLWSGEKCGMAGRGHALRRCPTVAWSQVCPGQWCGGRRHRRTTKWSGQCQSKRRTFHKKKSKWWTVRLFVVHLPLPCQYHTSAWAAHPCGCCGLQLQAAPWPICRASELQTAVASHWSSPGRSAPWPICRAGAGTYSLRPIKRVILASQKVNSF